MSANPWDDDDGDDDYEDYSDSSKTERGVMSYVAVDPTLAGAFALFLRTLCVISSGRSRSRSRSTDRKSTGRSKTSPEPTPLASEVWPGALLVLEL